MLNLLRKIFGSKNDRELKRIRPLVQKAGKLEEAMQQLSDEELRGKTEEFRARIREQSQAERNRLEELKAERDAAAGDPAAGEGRDFRAEIDEAEKALRKAENDVLDDLLPEAFAAVREASRRTIGLRHYDVQLIGGTVLHQGQIAEMKTGEGKTLVATGGIYLNSLPGRGAHLITVNDYLARRDVQWMGPIYHALGLTCAAIVHEASYLYDPTWASKDYRLMNLRPIERKDAYLADITYGTNHEFGFDYLRDNMKFSLDEYVQRELNYAIVDEVDNILIDEARTPLIISGPAEESTDKYQKIDRVIPRLKKGIRVERQGDTPPEESGDYWVDEKSRSAVLTETGVAKVERMLGVTNLYDPGNIHLLHHVNQALKAHAIFKRDVDYIIKEGQVIIVDEFTGRLMPGRRWSDGLHQAVEAKEGVRIERENQTLATITIQNYFRMYHKLAGMTGTADTESVEFKNIYKLDVVVVPPNKKMSRVDHSDVVYKTEREKFNAVVDEVALCHEKGQPVLVGTVSVEKSEVLSKLLKKKGIRHNVLNAVNHEAEATVIAQAGRFRQVTIATNMAGRGTDILLGGNPEFLARADMENEWIKRSAKLPEGGGQRFEESLQRLRERFEEQVHAARDEYEPRWKPFEEAQAEALEQLSEAHRAFLEAEFWRTRREYLERAAEIDGEASALHRQNCAVALQQYAEALIGIDRVVGPFFGDEGERRFERVFTDFRTALEDSAEGSRATKPRDDFDRVRNDYERAIQKALTSADGQDLDFAAARRLYEDTEAAYRNAEAAYSEHRVPYEEAVARAQADYEEARRSYTQAIETVREEMEKAPHEFEDRYNEILARYQATCAAEREQVLEAGGLHIIGTERHESRRIDNQLRGRAGRQGDPGSSRFYLSLEDDLLRIFGAERIQKLMERLGMEEGEPIEHRLISRAVANAQSKVEGHNFDIRKHTLEYDDVMNQQRFVVYTRRREILLSSNLKADVVEMADNVAAAIVSQYADAEIDSSEWSWDAFGDAIFKGFNIRINFPQETRDEITAQQLENILIDAIHATYEEREQTFTPPVMRHLEKLVLLQTLDQLWKDHLLSMDHLKEGINLRGYGQKNPLQEYKKEGFELFGAMMGQLEEDVVQKIYTVQIARQEDVQRMEEQRRPQPMVMSGGGTPEPAAQPGRRGAAPATAAQRAPQPVRVAEADRIGRNDPCPCGSGKKYKKCHGS